MDPEIRQKITAIAFNNDACSLKKESEFQHTHSAKLRVWPPHFAVNTPGRLNVEQFSALLFELLVEHRAPDNPIYEIMSNSKLIKIRGREPREAPQFA